MAKKKRSTKPKSTQEQRIYAGAVRSRLNTDWIAQSTSADAEIWSSLRVLRDRSRALCRDNDYAIGAVRSILSNVLGDSGIRMESKIKMQRGGALNDALNTSVEGLWQKWGKPQYCDVAGALSWRQIERLALKSVIESGEVLIRKVHQPFRNSPVPFALQIIESDQLADDYTLTLKPYGNNIIKMGVELDEWGGAAAYWIYPYHPGDQLAYATDRNRSQPVRVPASEIVHLYVCDRPGQTRGVPWLAAAINRLRHVGGYEEAEIIKARAHACAMGFIQSVDSQFIGDTVEGKAKKQLTFEAGTIHTLEPGETFNGFAPTSPNQALEPFLKFMIRSTAAGMGIGYEELSKDYSQTSYGSQRASMLESRAIWRVMQAWLWSTLHQNIFETWIESAVIGGALRLPSYELAADQYNTPKWMPRGWTWIDPMKDVRASATAIESGLSTLGRELADQGLDFEDLIVERQREIDLLKKAGVGVSVYAETMPQPNSPAKDSAPKNESVTQPSIPNGFTPVRSVDGFRAPKCKTGVPCGNSCQRKGSVCKAGLSPAQLKLAKQAQAAMKKGQVGAASPLPNPPPAQPSASATPTVTQKTATQPKISQDIQDLRSAVNSGDWDAMVAASSKIYAAGKQNATDLGIDFYTNINGGNGSTDPIMNVLLKGAGFNEPPTAISKQDMAALDPKQNLILYRNPSASNFDARFDQFKNDPDYTSGRGIYCSGTYVAANYSGSSSGDSRALNAAQGYGTGTMKMAYDKSELNMIKAKDLQKEQTVFYDNLNKTKDAKLASLKPSQAEISAKLIEFNSQKVSTSKSYHMSLQGGKIERWAVTLKDPTTGKFTDFATELVRDSTPTGKAVGEWHVSGDIKRFKTKKEAISELMQKEAEKPNKSSAKYKKIIKDYQRIVHATIGDDPVAGGQNDGVSGRFAVLKKYDFVRLNAYDPTYGLLLNRSKIKLQDTKYK